MIPPLFFQIYRDYNRSSYICSMNFSKTTAYALKILSYMAGHESEMVSAKYLHEELAIPYQYLRQILLSLTDKGFIKSTHGRTGGYTLRKKSSSISIASIIDSIEGLNAFNKCLIGFEPCPFNKPCAFHAYWEKQRKELLRLLKSKTLADLPV